jgi:thiol-disulfide isomerase/thioredoxin
MWLEPEMKIHAPEIGRAWYNTVPLAMCGLRGRVVLVDFWDYTCSNCLRTLPYVKAWHRRYHDKGLTVIGVHSPEFSFARTAEHVEQAIREQELDYPIVLDNEFQIWQSFANRCWPTKYLIDQGGLVRYYHLGEGGYAETEAAIQALLHEIDQALDLPATLEPLRGADRPGARCYPVTPELYLGAGRGRLGNKGAYAESKVMDYKASGNCQPDLAYLEGPWFASKEFIASCPLEDRPSQLRVRCTAAEVNLVMSAEEIGGAVADLRIDGAPARAEEAGEDLQFDGEKTTLAVREPRMYRLLKSDRAETRLIELSTLSPGLEAYAFTFVSCVME